MEYIKKITVDLAGEMLFEHITAVQGDTNSRFIEITLLSNAQPYIVPPNATAVLRCEKPDGTNIFNNAIVTASGKIITGLTEQMLAAIGNCRCEVSLYGSDNSSLTSVRFIVKVTPAAVAPEIISSDEFTALTEALNSVNSASEIATAALEAAATALNKIEEIEAGGGIVIYDTEEELPEETIEGAIALVKFVDRSEKYGAFKNTFYIWERYGSGSGTDCNFYNFFYVRPIPLEPTAHQKELFASEGINAVLRSPYSHTEGRASIDTVDTSVSYTESEMADALFFEAKHLNKAYIYLFKINAGGEEFLPEGYGPGWYLMVPDGSEFFVVPTDAPNLVIPKIGSMALYYNSQYPQDREKLEETIKYFDTNFAIKPWSNVLFVYKNNKWEEL